MIIPKILTAKEVNAIKKEGLTSIGGAVGLYLLVKKSGHRYYVYRYKAKDGKRSFISIAPYGSIDLAKARERAREWKNKVDAGINPSEAKCAEVLEIRLQAENQKLPAKKHSVPSIIYLLFDLMSERNLFWSHNDVGETHTMRFLTTT